MHGAWKHRRRCSCTRPSREDARRVSPAIIMPAGPVPSERDVERDGTGSTGITDRLFFSPRLDLRVLDERVRDLLHAVDGRHEAHLRRGAASRPRPRGGGGRAHLEPSADDEAELPRLVREAVRVVGVCGGRERRRRPARARAPPPEATKIKTGAGGRAVHGLDAVVEDDVHELVEALEDAAHCGRARGAAAAARRARMRAPSRPPWNFTRTSLSMHFSRSMIDFDAMLEHGARGRAAHRDRPWRRRQW